MVTPGNEQRSGSNCRPVAGQKLCAIQKIQEIKLKNALRHCEEELVDNQTTFYLLLTFSLMN
jgi:hypothetical protein